MNYFIKKKAYSYNERMNAIMHAPTSDFKEIGNTIHQLSLASTEQYSVPFKELVANDSNLQYITPTSPGKYIRQQIERADNG